MLGTGAGWTVRQHRPGEFETIDIALIEAPGLRLGKGLPRGSADGLKQLDHVAIAGFPNHNFGDTGILLPGIIVGFRQISSIRRLLVNAPIVAGNSGGPAINARAEVVGVAQLRDQIQLKTQGKQRSMALCRSMSWTY